MTAIIEVQALCKHYNKVKACPTFFSFPMLLLLEARLSLDGAPAWMSGISQILSLTHMVQAARQVIILCTTTAIFMRVSARVFKWQAQ